VKDRREKGKGREKIQVFVPKFVHKQLVFLPSNKKGGKWEKKRRGGRGNEGKKKAAGGLRSLPCFLVNSRNMPNPAGQKR